jgi:hypothetical protein
MKDCRFVRNWLQMSLKINRGSILAQVMKVKCNAPSIRHHCCEILANCTLNVGVFVDLNQLNGAGGVIGSEGLSHVDDVIVVVPLVTCYGQFMSHRKKGEQGRRVY